MDELKVKPVYMDSRATAPVNPQAF